MRRRRGSSTLGRISIQNIDKSERSGQISSSFFFFLPSVFPVQTVPTSSARCAVLKVARRAGPYVSSLTPLGQALMINSSPEKK